MLADQLQSLCGVPEASVIHMHYTNSISVKECVCVSMNEIQLL